MGFYSIHQGNNAIEITLNFGTGYSETSGI